MKANNYKIDRKSHPFLIYVGLGMIVLNIVLHFNFKGVDYLNPLSIFDEKAMAAFFIDVFLLLIRISMTIVAIIIAKRLMRSGIFWGIIVFLFPPISLIILGLMDVNIDSRLKKTLDRHRTNYFVEVVKIKNDYKTGKYNANSVDDLIEKSRRKHQELLTKALNAAIIENEKNKTEDFMHDATKCPACGVSVALSDLQCPKCDLTLK
jgi:hypothetical protein